MSLRKNNILKYSEELHLRALFSLKIDGLFRISNLVGKKLGFFGQNTEEGSNAENGRVRGHTVSGRNKQKQQQQQQQQQGMCRAYVLQELNLVVLR